MKKAILYALGLLIILQSCSIINPRYINSPSLPNTTFFNQQGDMKISIAGNILPNVGQGKIDGRGFDGQFAYAINDFLMMGIDGTYRYESDKFDYNDISQTKMPSEIKYHRRALNGGIGFFTPMSPTGKANFSTMINFGAGNFSSPFISQTKYNFDASYHRFNIHPAVNFFVSDYFRMSLAPRFSFVKYHENSIRTNYPPFALSETHLSMIAKNYHTYFEPSIVFQAGFRNMKNIKLDAGFHFAGDIENNKAYHLNSRLYLISFGLSYYPCTRRH